MKEVTPGQLKAAEAEWRKANPGKEPTAQDISGQAYQRFYSQAFSESGFGTGGRVQQAMQAATAAVQGLAGGNLAQAITGGSAPYLAEVIHNQTLNPDGSVNVQANLMAHAVVGAVTAYAAGNSAVAGASGAAMGEYIAQQMYPGVRHENLSEEQRQTISALGTLAAGLAGGVTGDSTAGAVAGAQAGKNAVENNALSLPGGLMSYGAAVKSWNQYAEANGLTPEQKQAGLDKQVKGDLPEGANITKVIVDGYKDGVLIAGAAYLGPAASAGKVVAGAAISEIANGTYQWFYLSKPENESKGWDYWGSASAGITGALAPGRNIWQNAGIAAGGTLFTDGPDKGALIGTGAGWAVGSVVGVVAPPVLKPVLGTGSGFVSDVIGSVGGEFISNKIKDKINKKGPNDAER